MAKKQQRKGGHWVGGEVEHAAPGKAESDAARAEGDVPVSTRPEEAPAEAEAETDDARRARGPSTASPDDEIADAADAHSEDEAARHRPGHGKL